MKINGFKNWKILSKILSISITTIVLLVLGVLFYILPYLEKQLMNEKIAASLPVNETVLPKDDAVKTGARHFFDQKYPDEVSVYYIGNSLEEAYSKEFCGGPHVGNTAGLGRFRITNEESSSAGVRRIKAVLE